MDDELQRKKRVVKRENAIKTNAVSSFVFIAFSIDPHYRTLTGFKTLSAFLFESSIVLLFTKALYESGFQPSQIINPKNRFI